MRDAIVVERYAEAFIEFVKQNIGVKKALEDLKNLRNTVMQDNPEFLKILESFEITYAEKCDFIETILAAEYSEELRHFLKLLLEKGRINKISDIAEYLRVKYAYGEEEEALLKTAFPLELELIQRIKEKLEAKFKKKFKLYIELDGTLLGGVQVIIGNTVIDSSVYGKLNELKEKLMAVRV